MLTQVCLLSSALPHMIMHPSGAFFGCTSLTSANLSGVTSIGKCVAAPSRFPPFSSAPFFQILLCDCENSSHHAIAFSFCDLHVCTNPTFAANVTVVNHVDHCLNPIAIIAPWRPVAALFVRVAIPAIDGLNHFQFCCDCEC
jgi:hypothetical protein